MSKILRINIFQIVLSIELPRTQWSKTIQNQYATRSSVTFYDQKDDVFQLELQYIFIALSIIIFILISLKEKNQKDICESFIKNLFYKENVMTIQIELIRISILVSLQNINTLIFIRSYSARESNKKFLIAIWKSFSIHICLFCVWVF